MKIKGEFPGVPTVDFLFGLVAIFIVLFILATLISNTEKTAQTSTDQEVRIEDSLFVIKMVWDAESSDDIDLYVCDPMRQLVFFKNPEKGLMGLDRDDSGWASNTAHLPGGKEVIVPHNVESVNIRGIVPGEYTVNAHAYRKWGNKPLEVTVTLYKIGTHGGGILLHQKVLQFLTEREEQTAFRFVMSESGEIISYNEKPRHFVGHTEVGDY